MAANEFFFYWYFREQSLIDRAADVFNFLKSVENTISINEWTTTYDQKIQIDDAENSIQILLNHFKKEIKKHYKVKEISDSFSENVGSVITLKSVGSAKIKLKFIIGASHRNIPNSLIVEGLSMQDSNMMSFFKLAISHFNVDWATVTNFKFADKVLRRSTNEFLVGWLLYLSKKIKFDYSKLNCEVQELNNGVLVQVTDTQFDTTNPTQVEKVLSVVQVLRNNKITKEMLTTTKNENRV